MAIQQEIWLPEIVQALFPDNTFWMNSRDEAVYLQGNKTVHIPQSGGKANVVKNRSVFPATVSAREDMDITYDIDSYTSDPIVVRDAEQAELSYQKRQDVIQHQMLSIKEEIADNMLVNWAAVGTDNIVRTSGSAVAAKAPSATGNRKAVKAEDIISLQELFDSQDVPEEGRYLILPSNMYSQLVAIDALVEWQSYGEKNIADGNIPKLFGFYILRRSKVLVYTNDSPPVVKAVGAAGAAADNLAALAWQKDMVTRAVGEVMLYTDEKDPTFYGDVMSVEARAGGRKRRNDHAGVAALVQAAA